MKSNEAIWPVVRRLFGEHAWEYAPRYAVAFVFMAIVAGSTALTAWLMRDVINDVFVDRNQQALVWLPLVITALFVAKGVAAYIQEILLSRIGNQIVAHMQGRIYDH